ncbi:MAG TPA: acetyl-CoA carboxylase biotin carboxyl carrier protein subunit [Bacteroidales bacterium]|nr:acetyl-CoA carboxylase biotin carboxyl carrier protein subunit [Bacteroidales bacterium]
MTISEDNFGYININSGLYKTRISDSFKNRKPYAPIDPKFVLSFIPGTIIDIMVKEGQYIKKGDELMILEAMKMKNRLKSSTDGRIKKIAVNKGTRVPKGIVLIELE